MPAAWVDAEPPPPDDSDYFRLGLPCPAPDSDPSIEVGLEDLESVPEPPPTRPSCPAAKPPRYELIDALGVVTILSEVELEVFCLELDDTTRDALMRLMPGDGCAGPDWMIRRMLSSEAPLSLNYPPTDRISVARPEPPASTIYHYRAIHEDRITKEWVDENGRKRRQTIRGLR
jgi:hypothetical protein